LSCGLCSRGEECRTECQLFETFQQDQLNGFMKGTDRCPEVVGSDEHLLGEKLQQQSGGVGVPENSVPRGKTKPDDRLFLDILFDHRCRNVFEDQHCHFGQQI